MAQNEPASARLKSSRRFTRLSARSLNFHDTQLGSLLALMSHTTLAHLAAAFLFSCLSFNALNFYLLLALGSHCPSCSAYCPHCCLCTSSSRFPLATGQDNTSLQSTHRRAMCRTHGVAPLASHVSVLLEHPVIYSRVRLPHCGFHTVPD